MIVFSPKSDFTPVHQDLIIESKSWELCRVATDLKVAISVNQ